MKLYQLVASGGMHSFDGGSKLYSKKVFTDRSKAEEYQEEFKKRCCLSDNNKPGMFDLDINTVSIKIVELELEEK